MKTVRGAESARLTSKVPTLLLTRIIPRAQSSEILGFEGETLKLRIAAPPVDGKANEECRRFLARSLDVAPSRVRLVRGQTSRMKAFSIEGLSIADVRSRLSR